MFPRSVWMMLATLSGLLGLQSLLLPTGGGVTVPQSASTTPLAVEFVGTGAIELSVSDAAATAIVMIRNDGASDVDAKLETTMLDRRGQILGAASREARLNPHRATAVRLTMTPDPGLDAWLDDRLPATGVVVLTSKVSGTGASHGTAKARDLVILQVRPSSAEMLVTLSGLFAAAVTVWATVGQLGLSALLFLELGLARVISPTAAYAVAGLAGVVALLIVVYAVRAVGSFAAPAPAAQGQPAAESVPRQWALL